MIAQIAVFSPKTDAQRKKKAFCSAKVLQMETLARGDERYVETYINNVVYKCTF